LLRYEGIIALGIATLKIAAAETRRKGVNNAALIRIGDLTRIRADTFEKFEAVETRAAQFRCRMPLPLKIAFKR